MGACATQENVDPRDNDDLDDLCVELVEAASKQQWSKVGDLIAANVNPSSYDHHTKWAPVHWAAFYDNPNILEALLLAGADTKALTTDGESPLQIAEEQSSKASILILKRVCLSGPNEKLAGFQTGSDQNNHHGELVMVATAPSEKAALPDDVKEQTDANTDTEAHEWLKGLHADHMPSRANSPDDIGRSAPASPSSSAEGTPRTSQKKKKSASIADLREQRKRGESNPEKMEHSDETSTPFFEKYGVGPRWGVIDSTEEEGTGPDAPAALLRVRSRTESNGSHSSESAKGHRRTASSGAKGHRSKSTASKSRVAHSRTGSTVSEATEISCKEPNKEPLVELESRAGSEDMLTAEAAAVQMAAAGAAVAAAKLDLVDAKKDLESSIATRASKSAEGTLTPMDEVDVLDQEVLLYQRRITLREAETLHASSELVQIQQMMSEGLYERAGIVEIMTIQKRNQLLERQEDMEFLMVDLELKRKDEEEKCKRANEALFVAQQKLLFRPVQGS